MACYPADDGAGPTGADDATGATGAAGATEPAGADVVAEADAAAEPGDTGTATDRWIADTVRLRGPREEPLPHRGHDREYRLFLNVGYPEWGRAYRHLFAEGLRRRLRDGSGRAPSGVTLTSNWVKVDIPWQPPGTAEVYRQPLGGWGCGEGS